MRFIFKTDYEQDIRLAKHGGHVFWYGLLCSPCSRRPGWCSEYWLAQLTFVLIYAVVGLGLMLLAGFTGLFSLGHAAFLGVGAYTQAVLLTRPWAGPSRHLALAGGRCSRPRWAWWWACRRCASRASTSASPRSPSASSSKKVFARWESRHRRQRRQERQKPPSSSAGRLDTDASFYFCAWS